MLQSPFDHHVHMLYYSISADAKIRFQVALIQNSVDDEIKENNTETIAKRENILSVFGARTPFS